MLITKDTMDNIEEILFNMVKQAVLKAIGHVSIISMLLILPTFIPCYLFLSMMTKTYTSNQASFHKN